RKPVRPVLIARAERLFDEKSTEPGTVDKQIALNGLSVGKDNGLLIAALAIQHDINDLALDPLRAAGFGVLAEKCGVEAGVEVERVAEVVQRRPRGGARAPVSAKRSGNSGDRPRGYVLHHSALPLAQ